MSRALALVALLMAACASREIVAPPAPASPDAPLLALRIRLKPPPQERAGVLKGGWFVRMPEGAAPPEGGPVLRASAASADVLYLANAEPGRYALVAVEEHREGRTRTTWVPLDGARVTLTELAPGARVMLGTLTIEQKARVSLDDAQRGYRSQVLVKEPTGSSIPEWLGTPREFVGVRASLDASNGAREALTRDARRHLQPCGWEVR